MLFFGAGVSRTLTESNKPLPTTRASAPNLTEMTATHMPHPSLSAGHASFPGSLATSIPDVLPTPSLHSNGTRLFRFTSPANQTADLSDESEMEDYFHSDSDESADLSQSSSSSYSSESDDSFDDASDSESDQDSTVPSDSERLHRTQAPTWSTACASWHRSGHAT